MAVCAELLNEENRQTSSTKTNAFYREQPLSGKVVGIGVETKDGFKTMKATKGIILATGGFSADVPMRSRYVPMLTKELPTTNSQ